MGAQCSKASEQDQVSNEDDERQNASPSLRTWHSFQGTRNGIESAGAGNHQVANADLATQGGSFLSFATRSHELSPDKVVRSYGYEPERNKEEKKKLARVLSDKATSVRSRTATVAKKGASRVCYLFILFYILLLHILVVSFQTVLSRNHKPGSTRPTVSSR